MREEKRTRGRDDEPRRPPREAGVAVQPENGSTSGRTHDQVLDATLPHDEAEKAKLKRDRSELL